ncbi:MAG: MBL fold metallo-hydrolase [Gemmatimonadetes bacterium]|nr:MBL fold metallo-hydrolase [Gemmatimonadota bacterium]
MTVLGSGSRGNAIAFSAAGTTILVDAGFPLRTLKRRAASARLRLSDLAALVVTHEHTDHSLGAARLAKAASCVLLASRGTLASLAEAASLPTRVIAHLETVTIGPFGITACRIAHDAAEPLALAIVGPDGEKAALAYDLGGSSPVLRYLLRSADCLIVESNHDEAMLRAGPYPASVRRRIAGPDGHLSNRAAATLLAEACHPALATIVLAHVSEVCNRKELAEETTRRALVARGFGGKLFVADQDAGLQSFDVARA